MSRAYLLSPYLLSPLQIGGAFSLKFFMGRFGAIAFQHSPLFIYLCKFRAKLKLFVVLFVYLDNTYAVPPRGRRPYTGAHFHFCRQPRSAGQFRNPRKKFRQRRCSGTIVRSCPSNIMIRPFGVREVASPRVQPSFIEPGATKQWRFCSNNSVRQQMFPLLKLKQQGFRRD